MTEAEPNRNSAAHCNRSKVYKMQWVVLCEKQQRIIGEDIWSSSIQNVRKKLIPKIYRSKILISGPNVELQNVH